MPPKKDTIQTADNQPKPSFMTEKDLASKYIGYISLKSEKLATATYMVTGFLSDNEPLKWKIRTAALMIMSDIKKHISPAVMDNPALLQFARAAIAELDILLHVAAAESAVSDMNFSILRQEYQSLGRFIEEKCVRPMSDPALEEIRRDEATLATTPKIITAGVQEKTVVTKGYSRPEPQHREKSSDNGGRREAIVSYIRAHGWSAIKDIAGAVPGCSLKTVQRELVDLVGKNVLRKRGERRWSRYQLV